ncbi:alpha/beta hydrolase [Halotia branconii]|uniref:Alpha/beta hydrolase n=1 Tax=Halotia branconii CENA392 TaxID=1539056 RepID=A0AAJ6NXI9_9CYAN|nr:alpha/beta hydrolase [Halotia branconii]WGV28442.1 alpha/beta hydrolase [Halotia branconii CENA392]
MHCQFLSLHQVLILIFASSVIFFSNPVFAAEQVVLKYGIFRESLAVKELSKFGETGELSRSLRVNLALARQNPRDIRQYLTTPVQVSPVFLDKVLNSQIGNVILDELSQVIHTPSRKADRQALRSALVLSASQDQQMTLLEVIQNYPTTEVEVEGERLENAYLLLRRLQGSLQDLINF